MVPTSTHEVKDLIVIGGTQPEAVFNPPLFSFFVFFINSKLILSKTESSLFTISIISSNCQIIHINTHEHISGHLFTYKNEVHRHSLYCTPYQQVSFDPYDCINNIKNLPVGISSVSARKHRYCACGVNGILHDDLSEATCTQWGQTNPNTEWGTYPSTCKENLVPWLIDLQTPKLML
jgi:hypothetical protein